MTLHTGTIASAIAAMSISGVSILTIAQIPDQIQGRAGEVPVLYPHPDGFVTGGTANADGMQTFGPPTSRFWLFERTLRYQYLHAKVGAGRSISDYYSGMCDNADAIMKALTELDVTDVDVLSVSLGAFGVFGDPATTQFFGFILDVTLREKVNA